MTIVREKKNVTEDAAEGRRINGAIAGSVRNELFRDAELFRGDEKRGLVQNGGRGLSVWMFAHKAGATAERGDNCGARLTQQHTATVWNKWIALPLNHGRGDVEIDEIEVFAVEGW